MSNSPKANRRTRNASPLDGLKASVVIESASGSVRIDEVPAAQAFVVLAELIECVRAMQTRYPELTKELQPVAGYSPLEVKDDDYEQARRVGFRA